MLRGLEDLLIGRRNGRKGEERGAVPLLSRGDGVCVQVCRPLCVRLPCRRGWGNGAGQKKCHGPKNRAEHRAERCQSRAAIPLPADQKATEGKGKAEAGPFSALGNREGLGDDRRPLDLLRCTPGWRTTGHTRLHGTVRPSERRRSSNKCTNPDSLSLSTLLVVRVRPAGALLGQSPSPPVRPGSPARASSKRRPCRSNAGTED
jgi:hypothetical protein